jgi:hypothetical protein
MGRARNFAVFHYDPEEFGRIVKSASVEECEFMVGRGKLSRESYFPFADTLATEVLMGRASSDEDFYDSLGSVMDETKESPNDSSGSPRGLFQGVYTNGDSYTKHSLNAERAVSY